MRLLICGDWHGNYYFAEELFQKYISQLDIDYVIQVGDFSNEKHNEEYLDKLDKLCKRWLTALFFIDGNHENFDDLYGNYVKDQWNDFVNVRNNISYIPRALAWNWDGVRFMGFGGAYSVDKAKRSPYINWFPQEMPTDEEITRAESRGEVDILFSHDCPDGGHVMDFAPFPLDPIVGAWYSRKQIRKVVDVVKPKLIVHGHYHFPYSEQVEFPHGLTKIQGLDADYTATNWGDTFTVIDTKDWK